MKKIVIVSVILIIFGIIFASSSMLESDNSDSSELEKQAIEILKAYKGIDGKGESMLGAIITAIDEVYPGQNIFLNPGTNISWSAVRDSPFSNTYQVHLEIKTSQENSLFIWKVDVDSKKVWSNQAGARGMLNLLDQT
ncbi:MAG: hypothetical protein HRU07_00240 [Nitrosopumilus sp.]|nr:hypothetical protein [Nitrosopumilus sp.]NRA04610.1 hypothetical protein [Nitrosopumilus sp.]